MHRVLVGVIGSGDDDPELAELAERVGTLLAERGLVLVNGGLGGVMAASARGCRRAGGLTVGLLPGTDPSEANPEIDIPVPTGMGEMRNLLVVRASSGLIAVGGGYGTLSEIALALKAGKPVVGLKTWNVSDDILHASGPDEAVGMLVDRIKRP